MTKILLVITAIAALSFSSCETLKQVPAYVSPAAAQTDITLLGQIAKQYVSADAAAKIHNFALQLNQASDLDLNLLFQYLPATTGSQTGDFLVAQAKAILTWVVQTYGARNATTIAYGHAIAAGLLANF